MPDAKLEQWIKDFEAKFNTVSARPYTPTDFIYDLRHKSIYLGIENINTESGTEEIIYCYIPSNEQGLVLKRENGKIGSAVSYGYISLDDFISNVVNSAKKRNQILEDILSLFSWTPSFQ